MWTKKVSVQLTVGFLNLEQLKINGIDKLLRWLTNLVGRDVCSAIMQLWL